MKQNIYFLIVLNFMLFSLSANANDLDQSRGHRTSVFGTLSEDKLIQITLETDLDALIENKFKDEYQKATVKYTNTQGNEIQRKIKLKARGKYRKRVCDFPPLKIKFSKDELTSEGLAEYNKIKLISHCFDSEDGSNPEQLMKEYLAYKTYNLISENSFQVKLALVTYKNTNDDSSFQQYAILIESTEELAERIGRFPRKLYNIQQEEIDEEEFGIVNAFQFMIGNRDWNLLSCKNLKAFPSLDDKSIMVVPYDFDFAGLVDAPYATLHPDQKIEGISERICKLKFKDAQTLENVLSKMENKKEEILEMVDQFELMESKEKKETTQYIMSFYKLIENRKKAKEIFLYNPKDM